MKLITFIALLITGITFATEKENRQTGIGTAILTGGTNNETFTGTCLGNKPGVDCASFGPQVCHNVQYKSWIRENCCYYCRTVERNIGPSFSGNGCYLKGIVYKEGQSWLDGCDYKCTCEDGHLGKYQCQQLCLNWYLPTVCHLDPPLAGKCCPTPNCPSHVKIVYPYNYKPY